jgi:hypothetical protein
MSDCKGLFCTLTYNGLTPELEKKHLQLLFKRLRLTHKFSYFAVAEYGEKTHRPHYHILFFGLENIILQKYWQYGFVSQSTISIPTIRYCCNYATKKTVWRLTSRRPALGLRWTKTPNYLSELIRFKGTINYYLRKQELPRYYKNKLSEDQKGYISEQRYLANVKNIKGQIKWLKENSQVGYTNFIQLHMSAKKILEKEKLHNIRNQLYYPV